jgi:hypothetical protein
MFNKNRVLTIRRWKMTIETTKFYNESNIINLNSGYFIFGIVGTIISNEIIEITIIRGILNSDTNLFQVIIFLVDELKNNNTNNYFVILFGSGNFIIYGNQIIIASYYNNSPIIIFEGIEIENIKNIKTRNIKVPEIKNITINIIESLEKIIKGGEK